MKNSLIYCFICSLSFLFFFTSCFSWAGDGLKDNASSRFNDCGYLVTKTPLDFDDKFGYEVLVYRYSDDSTKIIKNEVYVSKKTWERLPEPNDSLLVSIEYLEEIEYGRCKSDNPSFLWDFNFNQCVGYSIQKIKK